MEREVLVIGAGISGLALARAVRGRGANVTVLERARGVGGRCATRRVDGQPVDHGATFLHGYDPRFIAALEAVGTEGAIRGWPLRREGLGLPCQPEAFDARGIRIAYLDGVTRFPKHLARDLDVRLGTRVESLRLTGRGADARFVVTPAGAPALEARTVALAVAVPQAVRLLAGVMPSSERVTALVALLRTVHDAACLTVIARYDRDAVMPGWDVCYPERTEILQAIFNDTTKRSEGAAPTLVLQARPAFSRALLEAPPEDWTRRMLEAAVPWIGAAAARPATVQAHVWRHARVHATSEFAGPLALDLGGAVLALCGDGFHPAGGVEGAYASGLALADRLAAPD